MLYSLKVECPPKVHVSQAMSLGWQYQEVVVEPLSSEAWWEVFESLGCVPSGDCRTLTPWFGSAMFSYHDVLLQAESNHGLKPPKL
jgi:hypothetical protein